MMISVLVMATTTPQVAGSIVSAANGITTILGGLSMMGMMLIFVYKNRMLGLQNKADIETERTRRTVLEREVVELRERVARIEGGIRRV